MDDEVVKALALPTLPNLKEIQNACLNEYGTLLSDVLNAKAKV